MATTLKLVVGTITPGPEQTSVFFNADYADDQNKEWAYYTPAATLILNVRNEIVESQGWKAGSKVTVLVD